MPNTRTITSSNPDIHSPEINDDGRTLSYTTNDGDSLVQVTHESKHIRHTPDDIETPGSDERLPAADGEIKAVDLTGNPWLIIEDPNGETHMHVYSRGHQRAV